jgi:HD-GYP domain-containing protein (c-di-GMP phosphodiesterase class II)
VIQLDQQLPWLLQTATAPRSGSEVAPALRVKQLESELSRMASAFVCSLTTILDLTELHTGVHGTRLAEWAMRVAQQLGCSERELHDIEIASLLHDVGKVGVPQHILQKPGKLTPEEYEQVKKHPDYGWAILRLLPGFERVSLFVLHHHERMDGKGYPAGLAGEEIPLVARIVAIVDAFDVMMSGRSYRNALPIDEAFRRLRQAAGTQFDARIVDLFIQLAQEHLPEISRIATPA